MASRAMPAPILPYREMFASMLDGVLVAGVVDGGQRYIYANDAAARIFEVGVEDLLVPLSEFPARFGLRDVAGEPATPLAARALRGEIVPPIERLIRTPSGSTKAIRTSAAPLRDDHGDVTGAVVLAGDITTRRAEEERIREQATLLQQALDARGRALDEARHAADQLRAAEERFRALVKASFEAMYVMSPDWTEMRRLSGGGFLSDTVAPDARWDEAYILPEDRPTVWSAIREAIGTKQAFRLEHRVLRLDGGIGWALSRAVPIQDERGEIVEWFGIATDITDRKRAEEALRETDRRRTEFLGVLSHELRNPLAPIRNSIHLLEMVPAGPQAARARQVIRRQTEHLTRLVDDLLDVTRISRGKIQLRREVVDLDDLVRRTCDDHRTVFAEAEVELKVDVPNVPVRAEVDSTRIAQVLGNLLQNASKFTQPGGTVTVRLRARDGRADLSVRDDGAGIGHEQLGRMFEPFAQDERTLARARGGLGLGLALSKGLVELHGGTISVRSEGPGRGAEFTVSLPVVERAPVSIPEQPHPRNAQRRRRVLVIEDNRDAASTLADLLELDGHEVTVARNGTVGIALARRLKPDVVICDLGLPDVDGYEVGRTLRADPSLPSTRLIALSGYAQPEDVERARAAGFEAHLPKPAPLDQLGALLGADRGAG